MSTPTRQYLIGNFLTAAVILVLAWVGFVIFLFRGQYWDPQPQAWFGGLLLVSGIIIAVFGMLMTAIWAEMD